MNRRLAFKIIAINLLVVFAPTMALVTFRSRYLPEAVEKNARQHLRDAALMAAVSPPSQTAKLPYDVTFLSDLDGTGSGRSDDLEALRAVRTQGAISPENAVDWSSSERIGAIARGEHVWVLIAENRSRALPDIYPHLRRTAIVVELALLLSVVLATGFSWSLIAPLTVVRKKAEALATGETTEHFEYRGEGEIAAIARALDGILDRLNDQRKALLTYTAESSHRVRTSLSVVRAAAEILSDPETDEKARLKFALHTLTEVGRIERTLRDATTLARLEAGTIDLSKCDVDLTVRLRDVVDSMSALAPDVSIRLEGFDCEARASVDPERIEDAVGMLLENAIKYAAPDGKVLVGIGTSGGKIHIVVEDSGPGIPADLRPRIFERFFTTGKQLPDGSPATGLGLAIAKAIIEMHGGTIEVGTSTLGGAALKIELSRDYSERIKSSELSIHIA